MELRQLEKELFSYGWNETKLGFTQDRSLKYRINCFCRGIKYAWQRAWHGYEDTVIWNYDNDFINRTINVLTDMNKNRCGLWNIPEEYRDCFDGKLSLTDTQTSVVIETLIFHLKMMNEDYVQQVVFCESIYDKTYNAQKVSKYYKTIYDIMIQNKNLFMELFSMFFYDMWD